MKAPHRLHTLSMFLGLSIATASALGIFFDATYSREAPSYAAQGIGQDWINLLIVAPALVVLAHLTRRGSRKALFALGGPILYSQYSYALYAFTLHFNELFLLYCATLGLSFFGFLQWWFAMRHEVARIKLPDSAFSKGAASLQITIAAFFGILWLSEIIPAQINGTIPKSVNDSGLITNGVYVLDLSILLPALLMSAIALLKRRMHGIVLSAALLGFSALMALAISAMVIAMRIFNVGSDLSIAAIMFALASVSLFVTTKFISSACTFPRAILLVGVPGSGKSTYAKERFATPAHAIHSTDAIRGELFGDENTQGDWAKIEGVLKLRVAESIASGSTPIVDATHAQKEHRVHAIHWMNRLGAEAHALYVATPIDVCKERNNKRQRVVPNHVIEGMHAALVKHPPSLDDGFEQVEIVVP